MKSLNFIVLFFVLLLVSCKDEPTLQKFFVESQEKPGFVSLDISPSILNVNKLKLTDDQNKALSSFKKMNILAFKNDGKNLKEYEIEKAKIVSILKNEEYQQLMKIGSGKDGASVSFVGTDDNIDEFIFYGNKKENGFAVVRVLGDNMNPNDVITMLSVLKQSNIDLEQLKPLQDLMK